MFGVGDLQSGDLQSRATDFGSHNALIALVGGGGPEDTNIVVFGVGDLQSGNLQSRATDLGSRSAFIALAEGAGVMRGRILMYSGRGTYSLGTYCLGQTIFCPRQR